MGIKKLDILENTSAEWLRPFNMGVQDLRDGSAERKYQIPRMKLIYNNGIRNLDFGIWILEFGICIRGSWGEQFAINS